MLLSIFAIAPNKSPDEHEQEIQMMFAAQADPHAFEPLYERYFERIYAYCRRRSHDDQEAEDLCSQVFIRVLVGIHTYNGGMVAAWLFRVAHNVIVNHYRGKRQIISLEGIEIPHEADGDPVEQADDQRVIRELVAALPEDKRTLLSLALDGGLNSQEIGEILNKSAGAIRVELHRTIQSLRLRYFKIIGENHA